MPKRVVKISWHSIDNGRVGPHCGVDGTTPCRGADLSPLNSAQSSRGQPLEFMLGVGEF